MLFTNIRTVAALQLTCSGFSGHQSSFQNWAAQIQAPSGIQPLNNPWSNSGYIGTPFYGYAIDFIWPTSVSLFVKFISQCGQPMEIQQEL